MSWEDAKRTAWQAFGLRYWRSIVAWEMTKKAAPGVLAAMLGATLVGGLWWLGHHVPSLHRPHMHVAVWMWALLAAAAVVAGWLVWRMRSPYRLPLGYGAGVLRVAGVATAAACAVLAVGLVR